MSGIVLAVASVWLIARNGADASAASNGVWGAAEMCVLSTSQWASGIPAIDFLTGGGSYMARTQCMVTQEGETDWAWVWLLVGLNALVIVGYMKIFLFWRKAYLQEEERDRNKKLMDLAWIFLFCACCGYVSSIMLFFWPAYRLLALALVPLAFFTWKFAANLEGFRVSLSAKRLARQLNESLQKQNECLVKEVEIATADLMKAKLVAEEANQAKSEFLARMSHEIRTPLTAIMGYIDIAIEHDVSEGERLEHLETVRWNSDHLLRLINDVLDVSKIEAGEMSYENTPCSPVELVGDICTLLRQKADANKTTLHVEIEDDFPHQVMTDPTRLRQLITNLVSNAIKFTEDGEIVVHLKSIQDASGAFSGVLIDVRDTGIGMTPEQASSVFEKFAQADTHITRVYGGTGLGLTIAKQIAMDMGGDLVVDSQVGLGSCFTATICCRENSGRSLEHTGESKGTGLTQGELEFLLRGKRILLVEDSRDNRVLIEHRFHRIGVEIDYVEDGEAGYETVLEAWHRGEGYDIVIMDINMPKMDGVESLGMIRKMGCDVPVIMLSAHAMMVEQQRSMEAGASAYCSKPIDFNELFGQCARFVTIGSDRRAG